MKLYRFSELSNLAQIKAVYEYAVGWAETHGENDLNFYEIQDILLIDLDRECDYTKEGVLYEHRED